MRPRQPLPEGAAEELAALLTQCRDKATYQRVLCLWLRAALDLSGPQVALALGWSLSAVHHLQARYLREGAAALQGVGRGGRRHQYLSPDEEAHLLAGWDAAAGTGGVVEAGPLRRAYETAVGHAVPKSTVYRLLARHGWRKLVPRPRHREADPQAQQAFKKTCGVSCAPRPVGKPRRVVRCG